jgi:AcrR family transcriptional regulator
MSSSVLAPIFGTPVQLPRGPHALTREQVAASQRTRLMSSMAELVAQKGYASATITEVARRAGVSPNVFYAHFADKEECYLAAYQVFAETLLTRLAAEVEPEADWHTFISSTLDAYLGTLEAEPRLARGFLLEMNGAGPRARALRHQAYAAIAAVVKERHALIRRSDPSLGQLPDSAYMGMVHGVRELVCDALERDPRPRLTELAPEMLRWITAAVQGAAAAQEQLAATG